MASTSVDAILDQGVRFQLQGNYTAATAIAEQLKTIAPGSAIGESLELNSLATRLSWNPDDDRFDEAIERNAERALEICDRKLRADPDKAVVHYRCGQANFALSFLRGVRGQLIAAGVLGTRAMKQFERALELDPGTIDPKLQLGMAYFYADNLPSFIKAIASLLWFVPKGDSDKSVPYIKAVADRGERFQDVAKFVYADIATESDVIPLDDAETILRDLITRYPENSRFHLALIDLLLELEQPRAAMAAAENALEVATADPERAALARLWQVQALIALGEHERARDAHRELGPPPAYFPGWALPRFHLVDGQIHDLAGNRPAAISGYQSALNAIGRFANPEVKRLAQSGLEAPLFRPGAQPSL